MNIYKRKALWKRILFAMAALIVGVSLWYTQILVDKIGREERKKVELWAEAIQKKAKIVNYTDKLFDELRQEERKKVEQYIEAIKGLANATNQTDFSFLTKILTDNTTVPVILTDAQFRIKSFRNLPIRAEQDTNFQIELLNEMKGVYKPLRVDILPGQTDYVFYKDSRLFEELKKVFDDLEQSFISEVVTNSASVPVIYTDQDLNVVDYGNIEKEVVENEVKLKLLIEQMRSQNQPIEIHLQDNQTNYIYYKDSNLLIQLKYYPFVQFTVIGLFAFIAYFLFSYSRREEQNSVWVGMAKETAHQLGTPLSSLLAWVEILKEQAIDPSLIDELNKDLVRLETITERFSKIGAQPQLNPILVIDALNIALSYIQSRSSAKIVFDVAIQNTQLKAWVNQSLFDWVIENLSKNAIDAMNGNGTLSFEVKEENEWVIFDVTDTGKGIAQKNKNAVFEPGFTTKKRGWGLGLSLVKRIVENYHKGKIFVKNSQLGKGTTFRLMLLKA